MEVNFYYIKEHYNIDFLKKYETAQRGFTCVPNAQYWNTNKFSFGAVLEVNGEQYFVPVSSYDKKQQDVILMTDKNSKNKGITAIFKKEDAEKVRSALTQNQEVRQNHKPPKR